MPFKPLLLLSPFGTSKSSFFSFFYLFSHDFLFSMLFFVENLKRKSLNNVMNESNNFNIIKFCTDCKTTKTPLWRGGPAGPKSLCNACGIRYRKKKRVFESLNRRRPEKRKDKTTIPGASAKSAFAKVDNDNSYKGLSESFKMRLLVLGKEMMLQRPSSSSTPPFAVVKKKQRCQRRRKLKEEEQAAFSLMALSCGFVFA
ncbi:GATA transcription factor 15-like [Mangifera indica]|uniref:GATA transcription factor 15-like n=1 Tax=Mangifera indica TaxID=29780 RepID=UPI001CFB5B42|nr:GATA transcription factor 15-like [Mangifera indica]